MTCCLGKPKLATSAQMTYIYTSLQDTDYVSYKACAHAAVCMLFVHTALQNAHADDIPPPSSHPHTLYHQIIQAFVRSFTHSFTDSFIHSITQSFIHSFMCWFTHSSSPSPACRRSLAKDQARDLRRPPWRGTRCSNQQRVDSLRRTQAADGSQCINQHAYKPGVDPLNLCC